MAGLLGMNATIGIAAFTEVVGDDRLVDLRWVPPACMYCRLLLP